MRARLLRGLLAGLLGTATALLVACGSGKGLIPAAAGGPLQTDIEAVDQAAQEGNGNCTKTEAELLKTDQDFQRLPASLNSGLRENLKLGIENLHKVAKEACMQPLANTTSTAAPKTTTTPPPTTTPTTPTTTTPTTPTTTPPEREHQEEPEGGSGGGTPAPGEGAAKGTPEPGGGAAAGEAATHGNGSGGSESGKD